jgi:predicted glycosyltransferase involved in capsule biosynthesis
VGGFDERFVGWGHEDSSLNIQLLLKADWDRIPGEAHHLWHPEPERKTVNYRRNRQLLDQMRRENAVAIRAAAQRKGYDIGAVL